MREEITRDDERSETMRLDFGRRSTVALGALLVCGAVCACQKPGGAAGRLQAQIVDDATGKPLAARITITDANGKRVEIDGKHEHVEQLGKRWCYVDGGFSTALPGRVTVEIRRGLETRPLAESVSGAGPEKAVTKTFRLRRWTDMRAKGYVSGDIHAHMPALADAALEMRAEDLGALNLLITGGLSMPNDKAFKGRLDDHSGPDCEIYLNQEVLDWHLGHLTLAGLTSLVPGYPTAGGTLEYWESHPHWDMLRAARATRAQNGFVSVAHFENLPGAETPAALALGLLDAVELPTWSDPMQLPAHTTPWDDSGMSTAEFTPMRSVDLYYQFLNVGFRLPVAAGTDKLGDDIPVGNNRTYALTKGGAGYTSWLAAIEAGANFVTNGPIIEFEVDGRGSGEVVEFQGEKTVRARAVARSVLPFTTLDIMMNGRRVAHKVSPIQKNPPVDGVYTLEAETTLDLTESIWLAARAFANPDITPRILPRESSVFSHTSPVYFIKEGGKVREEASVLYLRKWVKGLLYWLSTKPSFQNEQDRAAVQRDAEEALRIYEAL
jgi:hypothetical protein